MNSNMKNLAIAGALGGAAYLAYQKIYLPSSHKKSSDT